MYQDILSDKFDTAYSPILHTSDEAAVGSCPVRLVMDLERRHRYLSDVLERNKHGQLVDLEDIAYARNCAESMANCVKKRMNEAILASDVFCEFGRVHYSHIIDRKVASRVRRRVLFRYGRTQKEVNSYFGIMPFNDGQVKLDRLTAIHLENSRKAQQKARIKLLQQRLIDELRWAHDKGYFVVFDTLTVDPENYEKVFRIGSTCFRDYMRRVCRRCGEAEGMDTREADHDKWLHRYFAVVERGERTGRLHIHCIHIMRTLPVGSADPNLYAKSIGKAPYYRELQSMKGLWKYGRVKQPICVRYSKDDAFAKAGWIHPMVKCPETGLLTKQKFSGNMRGIVKYLTKYLLKAYEGEMQCIPTTQQTQPLPLTPTPWRTQVFRTRMTRNFGEAWMQEQLQDETKFPDSALQIALLSRKRRPPKKLTMPTWQRLRRNALRELTRRGIFMRHFLMRVPLKPTLKRGTLADEILLPDCRLRSFTSFGVIRVGVAISNMYSALKCPTPGDAPMDIAGHSL